MSEVEQRTTVVAAVNWTYAYDMHARTLLRYLRRFASTDDRAEDLLHDVFERAMNASNVPPAGALLPWLYRIASNAAISDLRKERLRRVVSLRELLRQPAVQSGVASVDALEHVRVALRSIPPAQAVALVLVHHEGYSRAEAARLLGVGDATLKTRLTRGRLNFAAAYSRLERGLRA